MNNDKPAAGERPRVATATELRVLRLVREWAAVEGTTAEHFVTATRALAEAARELLREQPPATRADGYPPWVGQDDLACPKCGGTLSVPGDTYFDGNLYDAHCYECNVDIDVEASVEIKFCVRSDDGDE